MSQRKSVVRIIALSLAAAVTAGCLNAEDSAKTDAEHAARAQLKDPDSAKFESSFVTSRKATGDTWDEDIAVCGWVNAKNGFGGYAGAQRYVALGYRNKDPKVTSIYFVHFEDSDRATIEPCADERPTTFEKIAWNESCVDAQHPPTYSGERGDSCAASEIPPLAVAKSVGGGDT